MQTGTLLDMYLGFPLVQGRVTRAHVASLVDKIKGRITSWRCKLLSLQGRSILSKSIISVLNSIPVYNMSIHKWPTSSIKEWETLMRNFLGTGSPTETKKTTVTCDKVCK
ncbi:hypothetical protein IFM89_038421 [Coptis chinensis]|uniref:Uncharacterized protein n=1 Tax=Coptis chinensis TaxID=261450 RepID=A0A835LPY4_9MAGN|nr:hypothetical protein IFM89_038421 [Coptis chinensis]